METDQSNPSSARDLGSSACRASARSPSSPTPLSTSLRHPHLPVPHPGLLLNGKESGPHHSQVRPAPEHTDVVK